MRQAALKFSQSLYTLSPTSFHQAFITRQATANVIKAHRKVAKSRVLEHHRAAEAMKAVEHRCWEELRAAQESLQQMYAVAEQRSDIASYLFIYTFRVLSIFP